MPSGLERGMLCETRCDRRWFRQLPLDPSFGGSSAFTMIPGGGDLPNPWASIPFELGVAEPVPVPEPGGAAAGLAAARARSSATQSRSTSSLGARIARGLNPAVVPASAWCAVAESAALRFGWGVRDAGAMMLGSRILIVVIVLAACVIDAVPAAGRIVIVGVDGASWNRVDEGIKDGSLPNWAALVARGLTANLATVEPVISPTVWTSIATGRSPDAHGIKDFYVTARDVRVPTAFERLAGRSLRVGLYSWLVTWPPARFPNGFVIPAWLRRDDQRQPPDVFERAGVDPYMRRVERFRGPADFAASGREEPREKSERFVKLIQAFDLDVAAMTIYAIDATSHRFWRACYPQEFADGAGLAPDPHDGSVCHDTLVAVDRALGRVAASLAPQDTLLVLSDHGFGPDANWARSIWIMHPEAWFRRAEIDPKRDAIEVTNFGFFVLQVLPGPLAERETTLGRLQSLLASASTSDGRPLFRVEIRRGNADAVVAEQLQERINAVTRETGIGWLGPRLDAPAHAFVIGIPRQDVLAGLAPDARVRVGGEEVRLGELLHADRFTGAHAPTGVFVAAGGPVRHEPRRLELSVLDVAPLLFQLAGQPIPDDLEHPLRSDLLEPAWVAAHPPQRIAASEMPGLPRGTADGDDRDEAITERLRALGYVR